MTGHVIVLKQRPLNRKRGWTTTFLTPEGAWSQRDNYQAHLYSKEDCGRNYPSMSPGSRSGRGALTLTPAPNGAKEFYIACRTRCIAKATESWSKETYSFFREGNLSNTVPKLRRTGV